MDYLENLDALPQVVRDIVERYGSITDALTIDEAGAFQSELEAVGFEIDFDMSMSEAYNLQRIDLVSFDVNKSKGRHNGKIYNWSSDLRVWVAQ